MSILNFIDKKTKTYKSMNMPQLLIEMTAFLELNPCPIKNKEILKQGIELFSCLYFKAVTNEFRQTCSGYRKLYHDQFMKLE